jgi:hypothetical protein
MSLRDLYEADLEFLVGLSAASQVDPSNVVGREECLRKSVLALERERELLSRIGDVRWFEPVLSDIEWKESIIRGLPFPPSPDQLRALSVLVKARPFLSDIPST